MSFRFILILSSHTLLIPVKLLTMNDQTHTVTPPHTHQPQQRQIRQDIIDWRHLQHSDLHCSPVFTPVIEITDDEMGRACREYKEKI